jgi:hypothetical protein
LLIGQWTWHKDKKKKTSSEHTHEVINMNHNTMQYSPLLFIRLGASQVHPNFNCFFFLQWTNLITPSLRGKTQD